MSEKASISRQQQKSMETREKIFQAAKRILQKKGYEELSIKNICEEAGVSNGSFYHHFKTKDDLLSTGKMITTTHRLSTKPGGWVSEIQFPVLSLSECIALNK